MKRRMSTIVLLTLAVSCAPCAEASQASDAGAAMQRAGERMQQQDWAGAAAAYREAAELNPNAPWTWYLLGTALHRASETERAAAAWREALDRGISVPGPTHYNLACAYSVLRQTDDALEQLEAAASSGLYTADQFAKDPDLDNVRSSARYEELARAADLANHPCRLKEEYRQFDFWVGDWDARIPAGFSSGTNRIEKSADGCLLHQRWEGFFGFTGQSFTYYDAAREVWTQTWVGQAGGTITLNGGLKDGAMELEGLAPGPSGELVPTRTRWTPESDGTVSVRTEASTDGGDTFTLSGQFRLHPLTESQ